MKHINIKDCMFNDKVGGMYTFDVSQLEVTVLGALALEFPLLNAMNRGQDIHVDNYAHIYNVDKSDVTPEQRTFAKTRSFELQYGASAYGMAKNSGLTQSACARFIDGYYKKYPAIAQYHRELSGTVYNNSNTLFPLVDTITRAVDINGSPGYTSFYESPMGRVFTFQPYELSTFWRKGNHKEFEARDELGNYYKVNRTYQYSRPQILNYICQGTGYDIVNILRNNFMDISRGYCTNQVEVHDSETGYYSQGVLSVHIKGYVQCALNMTVKKLVDVYGWEIWRDEARLKVDLQVYPHQSSLHLDRSFEHHTYQVTGEYR
jgi:hypothetical protein